MTNCRMQHHLDVDKECLFIHLTGRVDLSHAQQFASEARAHSLYQPHFDVLTDLSLCDLALSPADLRSLATFMNEKWPSGGVMKAALIVDNELAHGLARMYEVYSDNRATNPELFHTDQANLYLDICRYFELPLDYQLPEFLQIER